MNLIVNGDDFGYSPGQNLGIIKAHVKGILTSTTAMANGEYLDEALALAAPHKNLGIGVHLIMDCGKSVLPASEIPSLVDSGGQFRKHREDLPIDIDQKELFREWSAQIDKLKDLGVSLTHMDGHHHMHLHPDLLETALCIAEKYQLPMRYLPFYHGDKEKKLVADSSVRIFTGLTDFYKDSVSLEYFKDFRKNHSFSDESVLEIMCHPAYLDDIIYERSSYNIHRVKELVILTSDKARDALEAQGVTLGNVRDFIASSR
ncbi:MAG TPA: hypothetical protein DHM90_04895 [Clostridiaceae bacterium]|nr:hypothetical protein [Clostridiaceae bacterium]